MSNFITNLARRSAGLAPVVAARVAPGAGAGETAAAAEAEAPRVARHTAPSAAGPAAGAAPVHHYLERTEVERAAAREPARSSAAEPSRAEPRAVSSDLREHEPLLAAPAVLVPARVSHPAESLESPESRTPPLVAVRAAPADPAGVPLTEPRRSEPGDPRGTRADALPAPDDPPPVTPEPPVPYRTPPETIREVTNWSERIVEPVTAAAQPVSLQPAAARTTAARGPDAQPAESRIVHVRIGAIEIHGAAPQAAAPPPAAAPAAASRVASAGGFDGFAQLRSYAPWER